MPRIPEITDRSQVAEEARHHADSIIASRGRIQPPYNVLLHSPDIAARTAHLAGYSIYDSLMPMDVKEIAISTAAPARYGLDAESGQRNSRDRRLSSPQFTGIRTAAERLR